MIAVVLTCVICVLLTVLIRNLRTRPVNFPPGESAAFSGCYCSIFIKSSSSLLPTRTSRALLSSAIWVRNVTEQSRKIIWDDAVLIGTWSECLIHQISNLHSSDCVNTDVLEWHIQLQFSALGSNFRSVLLNCLRWCFTLLFRNNTRCDCSCLGVNELSKFEIVWWAV